MKKQPKYRLCYRSYYYTNKGIWPWSKEQKIFYKTAIILQQRIFGKYVDLKAVTEDCDEAGNIHEVAR